MNKKIESDEHIEDLLMSLKFMDILPTVTTPSFSAMMELLAAHFNRLVSSDLNRLISILYHIDVNEDKLKNDLKVASDNETTGHTIAKVVIARLRQKQEMRKKYND